MNSVLGVLLAGGMARRMGGGDKSLRMLGGRPLVEHAIVRARPQVSILILNAAGDRRRFAQYGLKVVPDVIEGFAGPLAGVLTGLEWAAAHMPACRWVATFACDAPFFPTDLVDRLRAAVDEEDAQMACAGSGGRAHPVFALWPVSLAAELRQAMEQEDMRKIDLWTARYKLAQVDFPTDPVDPFFNINRPDDLIAAEGLVKEG